MNPETGVKIIERVCIAIIFVLTVIYLTDYPQIWGPVLGLLSLIYGGGSIIKGAVKYMLRIQ